MPVVLNNKSDTGYLEKKKHLLSDLEVGGFVTALTLVVGVYLNSLPVLFFAALFGVIEISNAYNFFCFCKKKK